MTISANSRYSNSLVVTFDVKGASRQVIVPGEQLAFSFPYVSHTLTDEERLDTLAQTYYGDATQWWKIADGNPDIALDWSSIPVGTTLRIPNG
jgi:nucleoid-associated protein YgaU